MARDLCNPIHMFLASIFLLAFSSDVYADGGANNEVKTIKGMFVFGSSVVDNGNNNNNKVTRGNYLPYGMDHPNGATGRYSNGKNVADQIADQLQIPTALPFLRLRSNLSGPEVVNGVNFAFGSSGILEETSLLMGVKSFGKQIKNFKNLVVPKLQYKHEGTVEHILGDYLFMVAVGNNDYSAYHNLHQDVIWDNLVFAARLVSNYFSELKTLYEAGARKFLLLSVYPVGCNPILTKQGNCIEKLNTAVDFFYEQLVVMVLQSKTDMPDAQFSVVNSGKIIVDMVKSANQTGFTNVKSPCCDTNNVGTCKQGGKACQNRNEYVYFDGLHLTEAASGVLASKAYSSDDKYEAYPTNLQRLVTGEKMDDLQ